MLHWRAILLFFICLTAAALAGTPESPQWEMKSEHDLDIAFDTGIVTATNGITVKYGRTLLTARVASLNQRTGDIVAEGNVRLEREGFIWTGRSLQYNFLTEKIHARDFSAGLPPFFVRAQALVGDERTGMYAGARGYVTTDDLAEPGYSVRAKSLVLVPGKYLVAKNATLYLGKTPVFWYPYYRRKLGRHQDYWALTPGYRSRDGAYLLSAYHYYWDERFESALHLDGRTKRGIGVGPDFMWKLPKYGEGKVKYYYIPDLRPGETSTGDPNPDNRQRVWFSHRTDINSNLTAKAVARWQSDPYIVRDFFEGEYLENTQPSSYLELHQQWSNFSLSLLALPRVNDFYERVEQLPDVKFSGLRQQIGLTPLYYESDSSIGWYQRKFGYDFTNRYSAFRADTFHQVLWPNTYFGWLNVTPRVGGRFTHYGQSDPYGQTLSEQDRGVFNTGVEVTFKASRVWPEVQNRFFQVDGLRHILEPGFNYAYIPEPNRRPNQLPQFQYELPTTELLPIDYPDYNSIDSIDSQNVLRLSLGNRLQTKRNGQVVDFLHWRMITDWRIKPRPDQETFSDFYSYLDIQPWSWLAFTSKLRFATNRRQIREMQNSVTLTPNSTWSWQFSHYFLKDDYFSGLGQGFNLLYSTFYYRVNENWGTRLHVRYEAQSGILEEQQYSVYRDLRSWTSALTFRVRQNHDKDTDFTVAFTFSLKAVPRFGLGDDVNRPWMLLGY